MHARLSHRSDPLSVSLNSHRPRLLHINNPAKRKSNGLITAASSSYTYQHLPLPRLDAFALRFCQVVVHLLVTCRIENLLNLIDWRWWEESRDDRASLIYQSKFQIIHLQGGWWWSVSGQECILSFAATGCVWNDDGVCLCGTKDYIYIYGISRICTYN